MKIIRVLNTNAILTQDDKNEEVILLGAGIGFKRKPGDSVDLEKIEKRFVLKDKTHQSRFEELINNIGQEYIMISEQIITYGKSLHDMQLGESIHISLADHIHTAVINMQNGIQIPNSLLLDIRRYYPNEYEIGVQGLEFIKQKLGYELPADEAGFIAMHFVNAQYSNENTNVKKVIALVHEINEMILRELHAEPDENSLNYYRYMTHLKFFAQRVVENFHYDEDYTSILDAVLLKFPKEYICSKKVCRYIKKNYNYVPTQDEVIYLTAHLAHLRQK